MTLPRASPRQPEHDATATTTLRFIAHSVTKAHSSQSVAGRSHSSKPAGGGPPVTVTGGCLMLQTLWRLPKRRVTEDLFGRVRGHLRLRRRIPNQTVKSLRGSRNGLLGLSCNRRNKHTDDKAHDRKIFHRIAPFVGGGEVHRLVHKVGAAERLCGIAGIAAISILSKHQATAAASCPL
jgi:hypothetical protein